MYIKDAVKALMGKPVCNAAYQRKQLRDEQSLTGWCDLSNADMAASRALLKAPAPCGKRVLWLVCNFHHPFGGIFTVLRIASALQAQGYENTFAVYDNPTFDISPTMEKIKAYFPNLTADMFRILGCDPDGLGEFDIGVATFWTSAYKLLAIKQVKRKLYLIQDYECAFYPAGTTYGLVENTYHMPFHRLVNTVGLAHWMQSQYPCDGISYAFTPCADERYTCAVKPLQRPTRVLFYMRPDTPRNAYALSAGFAQAIKARYLQEVALVSAGWEPGNAGKPTDALTHAGLVPYDRLPEFYAGFDIAVCFMFTKHPSYLPFELMASGALVIANDNPANAWFYQNEQNCLLARPCISGLMSAFDTAMQPEQHLRIATNGQATVRARNWAQTQADICGFFDGLIRLSEQ